MNIRHIAVAITFAASLSASAAAPARTSGARSGDGDWKTFPALNVDSLYHDLSVSYDQPSGVFTVTTTGGDPYVLTYAIPSALPDDSCVVSFEYRCAAGVNNVHLYFGMPFSESRSAECGNIAPTIGTEWAACSFPIALYRREYSWGAKGGVLRIDLGSTPGVKIEMRNLRVRGLTPAESIVQARADSIDKAKRKMAARIERYLSRKYASSITKVEVGKDEVLISGRLGGRGSYALADIAPYDDVTEKKPFTDLTFFPTRGKKFAVKLPRHTKRPGVDYDRALSKWAVVRMEGDSLVLDSHARYADTVFATRSAAPGILRGKKGVGSWTGEIYIADFDSLEIHSITQNIYLSRLISPTRSDRFVTPCTYGGKTYYVSSGYVAELDGMFTAAARRGIIVEAIILTRAASVFRDPECAGGYYTMPNLTTPEAVNLYAAALNYLAERYTEGSHGRIHHWIMHNEVDQGITWTNMGDQPEMRYFDRYVKSMRMCYNIVRQYDQHASVLGSYTHSWLLSGTDYTTRKMLEQCLQYSSAEGDFRWGVAIHPYPVDLAAPAFWRDDRRLATFSRDAQYVTFLNPEVVNDWMLNPDHFYKDGTKRLCFFSENGTNSPSYSEADLALQAAGAAWIWKKLEKLDGVDAIQWHGWKDNRGEFGLRIGLRAFADGPLGDYATKPAWHVWQAAGTAKEDAVFEPYLKVIGIPSWRGIVRKVE